MARKSFTVSFKRCDSEIGADALCAVFNKATDAAKTVHICEIRAVAQAANSDVVNATGCQGVLALSKISAASGGTELAPVKFDTTAANLPSQVKLYEHPTSITEAGVYRKFGDALSSLTVAKAIPFQAMIRAPGIVDGNDHSGRTCEGQNVWHADGEASTEPIVLREGEGIAIVRKAFGIPRSLHLGLTIKVASTGNVYRWSEGNIGAPLLIDDCSVALINGSGSGIVLQVFIVSLPDLGEENIPTLRVVRVAGNIDDVFWPGESTTVVPHDTANTLTDVVALRGPMRQMPFGGMLGLPINYHDYQGVPATVAVQQHVDAFRVLLGGFPNITETGTVTLAHDMFSRSEYEIFPGDRRGATGFGEIVLRPEQGVAIMGGGNGRIETSELAYLEIEMCGYLEEPSAVYPIENDVRNGVDYGPTGTEYDGDLVLPAIADVKNGVTYGADGTEYTGTYTAGGGAGISRSRAVNP